MTMTMTIYIGMHVSMYVTSNLHLSPQLYVAAHYGTKVREKWTFGVYMWPNVRHAVKMGSKWAHLSRLAPPLVSNHFLKNTLLPPLSNMFSSQNGPLSRFFGTSEGPHYLKTVLQMDLFHLFEHPKWFAILFEENIFDSFLTGFSSESPFLRHFWGLPRGSKRMFA